MHPDHIYASVAVGISGTGTAMASSGQLTVRSLGIRMPYLAWEFGKLRSKLCTQVDARFGAKRIIAGRRHTEVPAHLSTFPRAQAASMEVGKGTGG